MIAKVQSACLVGMEAVPVCVEVSLAKGFPAFSIVGLPDAAVREARDRVVAAIRHTGFEFPARKITVNLAPAEQRKEGAYFDLAIAVGILLASEAIHIKRWPRAIWLGELALDGSLRPVRALLPLVRGLMEKEELPYVLPAENWRHVSYVEHLQAYPFSNLREIVEWLDQDHLAPKLGKRVAWKPKPIRSLVDMQDIKGQAQAKRALEIAAAGNHNLLLVGPPGTGKSMLAQALPALLPDWTYEEALEATQIHVLAGASLPHALLASRPFRSPHHTASSAALIGGGDLPMPGEISLAHQGILFLDELPEFRRDALEALRQPLEEGRVHLQRVRGKASFLSQFLLIAAMNPCPCGYRGHPRKECICSEYQVQRYRAKISGPLVDRMDMHIEVPALKVEELLKIQNQPESTQAVRMRVIQARARQIQRFAQGPDTTPVFNAHLRGDNLKRFCALSSAAKELLGAAVDRLGFSARALDKLCRVARTIADLSGAVNVESAHIAEAIQMRAFDRPVRVSH